MRRWRWLAAGAGVVAVAVYAGAVLTAAGQRLENAALRGADQIDEQTLGAANTALAHITVGSLVAAVVLVGVIGWVRGMPAVAAAAVGIIVGGQVVTQTLKRFVLPRPELVPVSGDYAHNSLPSGHTTIAMTVLFALMVVIPYRWRGVVMAVGAGWAVGIGAYTVAAKWHRASDTIAADAIALAVACVACLILARAGQWRTAPRRPASSRWLRAGLAILLSALGAVSATLGILIATLTSARDITGEIAEFNYYLSAHSIAPAAAILAALLFWFALHRLETRPR
ncbi:phosphatase PAP2 family protein [Nocardia sp. NPDC050697]|uniref:phosphatase PAP2 family protein n=1 Tax=Nocardia sp. NPDC050697 TaxID=3155158 RepID=UPI0033FE1DB2